MLGVVPLVMANMSGSENTAEEVNTDVAAMGVRDCDSCPAYLGHVLMLTTAIGAIISKRPQLTDKVSA